MVDEVTKRYRGEECSHVNVVTFVGREPWTEKTVGCNRCGKTNKFTMITHSENSAIKPDEQDDEQQQDSDPVEETETDTETVEVEDDTVAEFENESPQEQDDGSVEDNMDFDSTKPVGHALPENYRDLQGVAGQFDIKKNQTKEELHNQIVAQFDEDPERYSEIVWSEGDDTEEVEA